MQSNVQPVYNTKKPLELLIYSLSGYFNRYIVIFDVISFFLVFYRLNKT